MSLYIYLITTDHTTTEPETLSAIIITQLFQIYLRFWTNYRQVGRIIIIISALKRSRFLSHIERCLSPFSPQLDTNETTDMRLDYHVV